MSTARNRPIYLFLCHELLIPGQVIAVAEHLKERYAANLDIHLAGFPGLDTKPLPGIPFHRIKGRTTRAKIEDLGCQELFYPETQPAPTSGWIIKGHDIEAVQYRSKYIEVLVSDPAEYVQTAIDIEGLIARLDPVSIVCEPQFWAARDAACRIGRELVLLSPAGLRGIVEPAHGLDLGAYPAPLSSNTYPVPPYRRFLDRFAETKQTYLSSSANPACAAFLETRKQAGYGDKPLHPMRDREHIITETLPELDYPFEISHAVATRVTIAGPIFRPLLAITDSHPDFAEWLRRRPTVLFDTRQKPVISSQKLAGYWTAIQMVLDSRQDLQLLWRLEGSDEADSLPRRKDFADRLRIHRSTVPRSLPILLHAEVPCFVGAHGDASIAAAMSTGTPVVTVTSFDGNGKLVEWLGIGEWGDRRSTPRLDGSELGSAILRVLGRTPGDTAAAKYRQRAMELSRVIRAANDGVEGRIIAVEVIKRVADRVARLREGKGGGEEEQSNGSHQWPTAEEEKRLLHGL